MAEEEAGRVDVSGIFSALSAAVQGQMALTTLAQQLPRLGAYRGLGRDNAIAKFSSHVCDALPKTLIAGAAETVGDTLSEKLATHNLLLQCLDDCGAFPNLHATVLRCLFEDGQRVQALLDVRELESKQQELQARGGAPGASPLHEVVLAAGRELGISGDPAVLFYACPTLAMAAPFFRQVAAGASARGKQPGSAVVDHEAVSLLSKAVSAALSGGLQQRQQQQQWHAAAINAAVAGLDEPEWMAGAEARAALEALAEACCRLQPLLASEAPHQQQDSVLLLFDITDRLLNTCAAAVAAAPLGQQRRQLHQEYAAVRDRLLGQLLQQVVALAQKDGLEAEHQLSRVSGLAEAHAGWQQLFDIADITGNREQLYSQMQQLRGDGLNQPLATFVFARLLEEGRRAELLDLPPQFDADLQAWLSDGAAPDAPQRLQLRWLHELRYGEYAGAAATLAKVVASQQQDSVRETRRLLALQKLAALAGGDEDSAAAADEGLMQLAQQD